MSIRAVEQAIRHGREVIQDYPFIYSEWRTRYILIDPIIRALGWKTESPWELDIEYQHSEGRVDYVLFDRDGNRIIFIEANMLGNLNVRLKGRQTDDERQLAKYIRRMKRGYGVLTDGREWHIFDTSIRGRGFRTKHIATVDVKNGRLRDTARTLYNALGRRRWW